LPDALAALRKCTALCTTAYDQDMLRAKITAVQNEQGL
jgi:hypothetical protein